MVEIIVYLLISILIGLIACFFGKKLYFPIIMLYSFIISFAFCVGRFGINWKGIIIGIIAGIVLALLVKTIYKFGIFILGALGGTIISMLIVPMLPEFISAAKWYITGGCALVLGLCAIRWSDYFIMLGTSLQGAATISGSVCFLLMNFSNWQQYVYADGAFSTILHLQSYIGNNLSSNNPPFLIIILISLTVCGFLFQLLREPKNGVK